MGVGFLGKGNGSWLTVGVQSREDIIAKESKEHRCKTDDEQDGCAGTFPAPHEPGMQISHIE